MSGPPVATRPRASTRVRAALAAGLVLGVTAGLTVASWTDAEYVNGTLKSSTFHMETAVSGSSTYTPVATSTTLPIAVAGIYPGDGGRVYAQFAVRRTAASNRPGGVQPSAAADSANLAARLQYRVVTGASTCDATAFTGSPTYVVGNATTYQAVSTALPATASTSLPIGPAAGATFCVQLRLIDATAQTFAGTSGILTLTLTGTST